MHRMVPAREGRHNLETHGTAFPDAVTALLDPLAATIPDDDTGVDEDRFVTMGVDAEDRLLVACYTWRDEVIRLVAARRATRRERKDYRGAS